MILKTISDKIKQKLTRPGWVFISQLKRTSFSTERLKVRFLVVSILGMIILSSLSLVGFLVQNYAIQQQESIQAFHSIVSKQVGTVQKMALLAEELKVNNLSQEQRTALLQGFRQNFYDLKESKEKLREWIKNYSSYNSDSAEKMVATTGLEEQISLYLATAETITDTGPYSPEAVRVQAERFTHRVRTDLVDVLNLILVNVVTEANSKARLLKWTSYSVVALVFGAALLLWLLVFRPMFKTILLQQESLVDAVYRAEAASRSKTEFLANVSHEIRTPMTAILGYAEVLESQQKETEPEVRQAFQVIKTNANHLMRLIDDILDVSKIEAGGVEMSSERVNLEQVLREVYSLLHVKAEQKSIYFRFSAMGLIPSTFHSDPVRLKQILFNVIGNAIKFTDKGGIRILISYIADTPNTGKLQFLIKDTGCGIPQDQVKRLFKPFTQVDTTSRRQHGGTGLGLVLSKRLANMLGGDVKILETVENEGTTFAVTIGLQNVGPLESFNNIAQMPVADAVNTKDPLANNHLKNARILVVDDAIENCNLFRIYLEKAKAKVDVAYNGNEALEQTEKIHYDLIFLDLQMPGKDGFEVLKELRGREFSNPIIALTAHAMPEERQKTLSYGFDEHVSKPVSADKLVSTALRFL